MANTERKVVFEQSVLLETDIQLLEGPYWINDTVLGFMFEYYQHKTFCEDKSVLFLDPPTTQLIALWRESPAILGEIIAELHINQKELVFLPVNDSDAPESAGGTHWALVVLDTRNRVCTLYDSMGGNGMVRKTSNIARMLSEACHLGKLSVCVKEDAPKQTNGYDCGMFVAAVAKFLCTARKSQQSLESVTPEIITNLRSEFVNILNTLANPSLN
eukprot:m.9304 g.9304  ORF g.9304 m.9304 type:complete len:216 (-) comp4040_c0_seq1:889-1536(-)